MYEHYVWKFGAGERTCPVCRKPLPAHETWPGARHPICDSPQCHESIKHKKPFEGENRPGLSAQVGLYIGRNERKCEAPGCTNFIPEGRYDNRADFLTCTGTCWVRRRSKGNRLLKCGCGCNQEFLGRAERRPVDGLYFLSSRHFGVYLHNKYLDGCGVFKELIREYLEGFATLHYRETQTVRSCIGPFFIFLHEQGITALNSVTPKTITQYLSWAEKSGRRRVARTISFVSTFFKWAIAEGHRVGGNPVVPLIHNTRRQWRMPRPLEKEELEFTWQLLKERGNGRLRLAAAIAEEAGMRIGEICRVRLQDIDLKRQRIFVTLPNKGNRERYAFFGEKTKQYYTEWMAERDSRCTHHRLLHNTRLDPCSTQTLADEFNRVLCKTHHGKKINETGWDTWSTHRFRHTMASNLVSAGADAATVMAAGGWKTYEAMCGYARVDQDVARRGYEEAMKRVEQKKHEPSRSKNLSLSEFLELKCKKA